MSVVVPADSTVAAIQDKVRELTASPSESSLSTSTIQKGINTFVSQDFPYSIKLDQFRDVYTFYTQPYIDVYPLDVNYNQGIREPVYFDGIKGRLYKDRWEFFNVWPRFPTYLQPISGDGTTQVFNFQINPVPFLRNSVTLGGVDVSGNSISVADDGNGNLQLQNPNPVVSVPSQTTSPAVPGMYNLNTQNPGLNNVTNIGVIDYVSGMCSIDFSTVGLTPIASQNMHMNVSWYSPGRPYDLLFWNNQFHVRPVPKYIHKVEVETYLTAVQFMLTTDVPILTQNWQYIAYGTAMEILRNRQDMLGLENLMEGFKRQEALVLERQATEEIGMRNATIFFGSDQQQGYGWGQNWSGGW